MAASTSPYYYDSAEEQQLLQPPPVDYAQEDQVASAREAALRDRVLGGYAGTNDTPYQPSPQATIQAIGGAPAAPLLPAAPPSPPDTVVGPAPAAPPANDGWATAKDEAPGSGPISLWGPEDVQPEKPASWISIGLRGLMRLSEDVRQSAETAQGKTPAKSKTPEADYEKPIEFGDLVSPSMLAQKLVFTTARSGLQIPAGILGTMGGGAAGSVAGPGGTVAGGVAGGAALMGVVAGLQELGPAYVGELDKTPDDPSGAFDRALITAGKSGAITGASMALFTGFTPFKQLIKGAFTEAAATRAAAAGGTPAVRAAAEAAAKQTMEEAAPGILQQTGAQAIGQPAIAAGGTAVGNLVEGKPAGEGVPESMPGALANVALAAATHGAARMLPRRSAPPPTADTTPPPVDPAVAVATQLALPPPSPDRAAGAPLGLPAPTLENRPPVPPVINVPPEGGQVSPADIVAVPPGAVDRPPIPGFDPAATEAARLALPPPSPENRAPPSPETRPTIPVPPEAGQVSPADNVAIPPGTPLDRPTLPEAPTLPLLRQGELPGVEPAPPQGELPLRQPPRAPVTEGLPTQPELPLQEQPSLPFKLADPTGWRVEPDDATPGQFVVKHGDDVLSVGSSPEEALRIAHERAQRASVEARATTGSEPPGTSRTGEAGPVAPAAAAPPPAAAETPAAGAAAARATRRAQMKPAAQEVLAKAEAAAPAKPAATGEPPLAQLLVKRTPTPAPAAPAAAGLTPHETSVSELPNGKFGVTVNGEAAGVKTGYATREQAQAIANRARQLSELSQWNAKPVATLVAKAASIVKGTERSAAATRAEIEATNARLTRERAETPEARRARIAREVKADLAETAEPPAGATPARRGMENIQDIPETQAGVAPTRTTATVPVVEGSELRSEQRAASTTSLELKASDLLHDVLADKITPAQAHEAYGEQGTTGGRPRTHATFLDYLGKRIENAQDPNALPEVIARARAVSEDPKLSPAAKRRAGDVIGKEMDRLLTEQENLPRMMDMHDELRAELARRESRAGRTARETDSEAALREMEEANKQPRRFREEGSSDLNRMSVRGNRARITEEAPRVNLPVQTRLEESLRDGVSHDVHDYLDDIINNPSARGLTPHFVALAKVLKNILSRGVTHVVGEFLDHQGDYTPDLNRIRIHLDANSPTRTLLHEALHAATVHYIEHIKIKVTNKVPLTVEETRIKGGLVAISKEIYRLRQTLDPASDIREVAGYSLRNPEELITYALTRPELIDLMARADASPELLGELRRFGMLPDGKRPSVFAAFKTAIGQIFGIGKDKLSVLDAVLRPMTEAVSRGAEFRRSSLDWKADDLRDASGLRVFERTGKLTDALPDAALREKLSEFGDKVATFNEGGLLRSDDTAMSRMWTRARREAGGGARWMRSVLLPASTTDQIVRYNRDVLPEAAAIRDARAAQAATTLNVHAQWNDRVKEWVNQLKRAGDQFTDLRNRISMAQAYMLHPDFEAANAHLKGDALDRARALKTEFDALPADQKQLYRELRDYQLETGWAERQADFEYLIHRALGDRVTPEERAELARLARSKPKLDQMIGNPDGSDLAALMAERWPAARNVVKAVAELQRKGWMEGDFTPLQRFGDYIVSYGEPTSENYGVHFFDTNNKAEAFRADFIAKNPGVEVSPVKQKATTGSNRYREFLPDTMIAELKRSLELRGIKGDDADGFLDAYAGMLLQNGAQSSAARLNVKRRNVIGASADGARNLVRDLSVHASRMGFLHNAADEHMAYLQADKKVRQLGQARTPGTPEELAASRARLDQLEARFRAGDPEVSQAEIADSRQQHAWLEKPPEGDVRRAGQVFDELKMRRTPVDGDDSSRIFGTIARRFTGASFAMHLMRPAHLAVQVLDAMSNAQSALGGSYGNVRAAAALSRALVQLAPEGMRAGGRNMFNAVHGSMKQSDWMISRVLEKRLVAGGMHADEARALIQAANDRGLIDHSLEREIQRLAHPSGFGYAGDAASLPGRIAGHMMDLFAAGEHAVDALNRTAILKAGYDLAKRANGGRLNDGSVDAVALSAAIEHASEAMPNYGIWNKPRIATERGPIHNPLVAATMQYKIYGMHMYSWMGSLVKEAASGPGPERAAALKTLAGLMATHSLLIGATAQMFGVPVNLMTGLWDLIHGEKAPHNYETDLRRAMTSMMGPTASTILSRGVLGLAGVDLHRSLKTSNMVDIPEMRTFDRAGVGAFFATALTGASGEVAQQLTDAAHQMFTGNFSRATMEMVPRMVGDVLKAHQLATEGMVDPRGNVIRKPSLLAPSTPYLRAFGFNPQDTALVYDRRSAEEEHKNEIENARSRAEDIYVQSKGRDLSAVRAFNANKAFNQGDTIEMNDLQNAVKRAQGRLVRPETYGLQFSKKQLPGALAAGRFN